MSDSSVAAPEKKTAVAIAGMRCMATSLPHHPYDTRALQHEWVFLDRKTKALLMTVNACNRYLFVVPKVLQYKDVWGGLTFNLCRMHHVDECLVGALETTPDAVQQVVFLGAGADCRATRYADLFGSASARAFELDLPGMMQYKRECVQRIDNVQTNHISYVNCDFERQRIEEVLAQESFDSAKKSLIVWEGVTYYLTHDAIDKTMQSIAKLCSKGSLLTFDFLLKSVVDGSHPDEAGAKMMETFKDTEPLLFGIDPTGVSAFLEKYGFELHDHLTPEKLQQKYMTQADGEPFMDVKDFFHIVVARKM